MTNYYKEEDKKKLEIKKKRNIVLTIILGIITLIIIVLLFLLVNDENHLMFQIIITIILFIYLSFLVFILDEKIISASEIIKHYNLMNSNNNCLEYQGKVVSINNNLYTTTKRIKANEVILLGDKTNLKFFIFDEFKPEFKVDDYVVINTVNRFIIASEVKNENNF